MVNTCLFTEVALGENTKLEHTIPQCMGGRITSRAVTSDTFNNQCGSFCDAELLASYGLILSYLAPLLPSRSQPPLLRAYASDAPPSLALAYGGELTMRKPHVIERDDVTRRPTKVIGRDKQSLQDILKAMKSGHPPTSAPLTKKDVVVVHQQLISELAELAIAKSVLLTFDCVMNENTDRFTRSSYLAEVRAQIRTSVEAKQVEGRFLRDVSLGIQIEKLPLYRDLRKSIGDNVTPFEHIMLIAGNQSQRCIDGVWIVFGFEPYGFRYSNAYDGPDFCYGLVNPILKEHAVSSVATLSPPAEALCESTYRRTFQNEADFPLILEILARVRDELFDLRSQAIKDAVFKLYMRPEANEWLMDKLRYLSEGSNIDMALEVVTRKLVQLFPDQRNKSGFESAVLDVMNGNLKALGVDHHLKIAEVDKLANWPKWLEAFRLSLSELVEKHGLPGGGLYPIVADSETWKHFGIQS